MSKPTAPSGPDEIEPIAGAYAFHFGADATHVDRLFRVLVERKIETFVVTSPGELAQDLIDNFGDDRDVRGSIARLKERHRFRINPEDWKSVGREVLRHIVLKTMPDWAAKLRDGARIEDCAGTITAWHEEHAVRKCGLRDDLEETWAFPDGTQSHVYVNVAQFRAFSAEMNLPFEAQPANHLTARHDREPHRGTHQEHSAVVRSGVSAPDDRALAAKHGARLGDANRAILHATIAWAREAELDSVDGPNWNEIDERLGAAGYESVPKDDGSGYRIQPVGGGQGIDRKSVRFRAKICTPANAAIEEMRNSASDGTMRHHRG